MFKTVSEKAVKQALTGIVDPATGIDIITSGAVTDIRIDKRDALFIIEIDAHRGPEMESLRIKAEEAVLHIKNIGKVTAVLTAKAKKTPIPIVSKPSTRKPVKAPAPLLKMPDVKHIIAVASGKGGVGKSTIAANLAASFANMGYKTGLMDADIYGPSMPRMFGIKDQKPEAENGLLEPLSAYGLKIMSMGVMVEEESPMIWRGPMIQTALRQFLEDVNWGILDIMVVDMPPGTGDAQLTMAQKVPLSGAVIVSTPQDIALIDARKGLKMFEKTNVPVLGIVENMSYFTCTKCNHDHHIFGHGGARSDAERLKTRFLGEVPLQIDIRKQADAGIPIVLSDPAHPAAQNLHTIAKDIIAILNV